MVSGLCFFIEWVSRIIRIDAGNFTGTDEAGDIIDMSICLVGIDAVLDPDDRIDIQIIFLFLLDLSFCEMRISSL